MNYDMFLKHTMKEGKWLTKIIMSVKDLFISEIFLLFSKILFFLIEWAESTENADITASFLRLLQNKQKQTD